MNFTKLLDMKNIIKIFLIIISIFFWIFFYVKSGINLESVIIFDVASLINIFFSLNTLIFLISFPLTTFIIISLSLSKDSIKESITLSVIGLFIGLLFSYFIFGLSSIFLLFSLLYIISHIILLLLSKNRLNSEKKRSVVDLASFSGSKVSLFLTIILFIVIMLYILPNQQEQALRMEAGVVNLFVGDDLTKWFGTSYSINSACTQKNLDFIMNQQQFTVLENTTDASSSAFVNFMYSFKNSFVNDDLENIEDSFPDLSAIEIKENVLETIRSIPLMIIMEQYFAIFFAFIIVSFVYLYFAIAFGLLGIIYLYIFYLLFKDKDQDHLNLGGKKDLQAEKSKIIEKEDIKDIKDDQSNKNPEDKESKIEDDKKNNDDDDDGEVTIDSSLFSQNKGPKSLIK